VTSVDTASLDQLATPDRLLDSITGPACVRALTPTQLRRLAKEIRHFLVASVARNGGHLGSNLGAVELTLALHRVFESPDDVILWDTGHQAYVHKMITGRRERFGGLRTAGGLSGYPNRAESGHDVIENSHASTGLSYAYGIATARALSRDGRRVVVVVGDGALTGGLAYEALNNIGMARTPVIVVLNDNGRSYAPTVSPLTTAAAIGDADGSPSRFFESLGLAYRGPVDGHDIEAVEGALRAAAGVQGPVVLHVHTKKGSGYLPAEGDEEKCLHDVTPFDPATGTPLRKADRQLSYTDAFGQAVIVEAERHPDLVAITAAMPGPTGLIPFRARYPHRFFDVGIAEQHAVTASAGMAMAGLRPIVAVYSTFLNRAWDQLYYDVGLHRLPVVFCIDRAGITGEDGPSHHGLLDLALLTKVPGMTVLAPSCPEEVGVMLREALSITSGPVAIRWPKTPARVSGVAGHGLCARKLRDGSDVCLLGVGKMVGACDDAAELLAEAGIEASVWDVRVAAPLDPTMLDDCFGHRLVLTAEDGIAVGGVGTMVAAALKRACLQRPLPPIEMCGVPLDYLAHGRADDILTRLGLDGPGIAAAVMRTLRPAAAHDAVTNGALTNGAGPMGAGEDGAAANGALPNGPVDAPVNGAVANGAALNGASKHREFTANGHEFHA
jgi:1-deoxy-D-xylulose-5-phosphate synthase